MEKKKKFKPIFFFTWSKNVNRVSLILKKKNVPLETLIRVIKYLEFNWKQERKDDAEYENLIMGKLSSELKDEVYLHTNVKYLQSVPVLNKFSSKTLISAARLMKKVRFCKGEYVYKVIYMYIFFPSFSFSKLKKYAAYENDRHFIYF